MKLIVGLGNPGNEYRNTRHNVGFDFIDCLCNKYNISLKEEKKFNALIGDLIINNEKVFVVKPLSYMNLSGTVVSKISSFYNISNDDILVIQDDLDMDFGKIRILYNSSSGGHNGIKNITDCLGTSEYTRLKIGISNNFNISTKDYVLGKFNGDEIIKLRNIFDKLDNIIIDFIEFNVLELKQKYNSMNNE